MKTWKKAFLHSVWIISLSFFILSLALLNLNLFSKTHVVEGLIVDQNIFRYMGEAWLQKGIILYKDVFDHKGPLLFFIQGLISFIAPYPDLTIFKCVLLFNLSVTITLIYLCFRVYVERIASIMFTIITVLCLQFSYIGNTCEEFTLPFLLVICFLVLRIYKEKDYIKRKKLYLYAFIIGISSSCIVLIRANNVIPVISLIILLFVLYKNQPEKLLKCVGFAFVGLMLPICLFGLYFILNGAFLEFIQGTFGFSLQYVNKSITNKSYVIYNIVENFNIYIWTLIVSTICLITLFIKSDKNNLSLAVMVCLFNVLNVTSIVIGIKASHYWWMFIPSYIFTIILLQECLKDKIEKKHKWFAIIIFAITVLVVSEAPKNIIISQKAVDIVHQERSEGNRDYYNELKYIADYLIEYDDSNYAYGYNVSPVLYWETNKTPAHRYWTFQDLWATTNYSVCEENVNFLKNNTKTKFVVIGDTFRNDGIFKCKGIDIALKEKYQKVMTGNYVSVYRINE